MNPKIRNNKILWSSLFWGWTILIVILTTMPFNNIRILKDKHYWIRLDYLEHLSFHIVLAILFFPYYLSRSRRSIKSSVFYWIIAGILFAVITEILQLYIPYRSFDFVDMLLNITGIFTGIFLGYYLFRSWKKQ